MRSPFELRSLIEWLEKQPADGEYNYCDPHNCLLSQYFRGVGLPVSQVGAFDWIDTRGVKHNLPAGFKTTSQGIGLHWHFGAALIRARALLAEEERVS